MPTKDSKLTGLVVESGSPRLIPFTTVALLSAVISKPVDGTAADEQCKFNLHRIVPSRCTLQISFVGYQQPTKPSLVLLIRTKP